MELKDLNEPSIQELSAAVAELQNLQRELHRELQLRHRQFVIVNNRSLLVLQRLDATEEALKRALMELEALPDSLGAASGAPALGSSSSSSSGSYDLPKSLLQTQSSPAILALAQEMAGGGITGDVAAADIHFS
jgi:hypothetical protein